MEISLECKKYLTLLAAGFIVSHTFPCYSLFDISRRLMYFIENPVLKSDLLRNLRRKRGFLLLLAYQLLLGMLVLLAWPPETRLDLSTDPVIARRLVQIFFWGQYALIALLTPAFTAGAISGEKERNTYEMLLTLPIRPAAIVLGKLLSSFLQLSCLIFASLPVVVLCLPLGGVSLYEVLLESIALLLSMIVFGMISLTCSSYFQSTSSALVVSYLIILPWVILCTVAWILLEKQGIVREVLTRRHPWGFLGIAFAMLSVCGCVCFVLFLNVRKRLLQPMDGSCQEREPLDLDQNPPQAIGLILQRDRFPDCLLAPPKRKGFLLETDNPVYEKEIHSEFFCYGTLMIRVVIQASILVAIPLMFFTLFYSPRYAPWYVIYAIVFNMLVGPAFSAGSITSERERQTWDLLISTTLTPWKILWGKLLASLKISSVLTLFLLWPLLLACPLLSDYRNNLSAVVGYFVVVLMTCITTTTLGLLSSVFFRTTKLSTITVYTLIPALFCGPLVCGLLSDTFFPNTKTSPMIAAIGLTSPIAAVLAIPLLEPSGEPTGREPKTLEPPSKTFPFIESYQAKGWGLLTSYLAFWSAVNITLLVVMLRLFAYTSSSTSCWKCFYGS